MGQRQSLLLPPPDDPAGFQLQHRRLQLLVSLAVGRLHVLGQRLQVYRLVRLAAHEFDDGSLIDHVGFR